MGVWRFRVYTMYARHSAIWPPLNNGQHDFLDTHTLRLTFTSIRKVVSSFVLKASMLYWFDWSFSGANAPPHSSFDTGRVAPFFGCILIICFCFIGCPRKEEGRTDILLYIFRLDFGSCFDENRGFKQCNIKVFFYDIYNLCWMIEFSIYLIISIVI